MFCGSTGSTRALCKSAPSLPAHCLGALRLCDRLARLPVGAAGGAVGEALPNGPSVALVAGLAAAELARLLGRQGKAGKQPTYRKSIDKANRKLLECWLQIHLLNLVLENEGH